MSWDEVMPQKSALKAADLQALNITACEVTIAAVVMIDYPATAEKPAESKPAIQFDEFDKEWPLNVTTVNFLKDTFGPNRNDCVGKKAILNVQDGQNPSGAKMKVLRLSAIPQAVTLPPRSVRQATASPTQSRPQPVAVGAGAGAGADEADPFAGEE